MSKPSNEWVRYAAELNRLNRSMDDLLRRVDFLCRLMGEDECVRLDARVRATPLLDKWIGDAR